ncbi:alpha/beta fold hydrolase [Sphingomonas arenae]|uniref:alpha/beta fold hydrolase n=1 Tax=Sphingomonas arenae TaxID=2812555 RepID=UPI001968A3FB|nr:alpha/beta fold hydrolase [Sphingomonas arenae]
MGWVETARGRIGMVEQGSGGVPLVLLHGVGSDKSVWHPQLDHFGASRRTLAFDYPGYGESDFAAGAGRDDFASAILAAMDALDVRQVHVCGLSLGGVIALAMHAAAPERCASLILADSFAVHPDGQAIHDRSLAASGNLGMRGLAESRVDALVGSSASQEVRSEVIETMSRIDPSAYALGARAVWLADQRDRAAAVRCPTLILCGTEDRITPPSLSEELKDLIPHAVLVEIAGAGHLSNLEQPAIFNRVVERFLAGIE